MSSAPARLQPDPFGPPRTDRPIDLDEHVAALPPGATCKGLFFADPLDRLRAAAPQHPALLPGGIGARRHLAFFDYSYGDFMRVLHAAATVAYPRLPAGEGLRRLGKAGYEAFLQSQFGRVLFGVLGSSFSDVVRVGVRGWAVCVSFGSVKLEDVGPGHVRYHFSDLPAFLETYQVGIVEGAMSACDVEGEVRVHVRDRGNATFDVKWRDKPRP